jgi:tetratricopeptide (TPR) repeat protein
MSKARTTRLHVEELEARTTPTIIFQPHFGAESSVDNGGYKLSGDPVYLIFWGSYWNTATNPSAVSMATALEGTVLASPYTNSLSQYGTNGSVAYVQTVVSNSPDPQNGFSGSDIEGAISNAIENQGLPEPDDNGYDHALYVVITPPGVNSGVAGAGGYNWHFDSGGFFDSDVATYAWVGLPGGASAQQTIDHATMVFSHEVAEAMTDPEQGNGIVVTASSAFPQNLLPGYSQGNPTNVGQIGDFEPDERYLYRLDGNLVQAYWSQQDQAFVVPDANRQNFILNPIWNGSQFSYTYNLQIMGDQLGTNYNDLLVIDQPTILLNGQATTVLQVTLNGEVAQFSQGSISSITVNTGGGTDAVMVTSAAAGVPVTITGNVSLTTHGADGSTLYLLDPQNSLGLKAAGINSFATDSIERNLFVLGADSTLWKATNGQWTAVDNTVTSFAVAPDGSALYLRTDNQLMDVPYGAGSGQSVLSNVAAFGLVQYGGVLALQRDGTLLLLSGGTWSAPPSLSGQALYQFLYPLLLTAQSGPTDQTGAVTILAADYFANNDVPDAIFDLRRAKILDSTLAASFAATGNADVANNDLTDGIYALQRSVLFDPTNGVNFGSLGQAYVAEGDLNDGITILLQSVALAPTDAAAFTALGRAYIATGNLPAAVYALERAQQLGVVVQPSWFPVASPADIAGYIAGAQLPNGAIRISQSPAGYDSTGTAYYQVDPYFANLALIGLLAGPNVSGVNKLTVATNYFSCYLNNLNSDGTIKDYWYYLDGTVALPATAPDSDDSYAATFLDAVWQYEKAGGSMAMFQTPAARAQLELIAGVMTQLQQANGLTVTYLDLPTPTTPEVSYLMDNSEVYAGLRAMSNLEALLYGDPIKAAVYATAAARVQTGIMTNLYNSATGLFDWAPGSTADLSSWYPGTIPLAWPILFGVISPTSSIAQAQMSAIDQAWNGSAKQDWTTRTDSAAIGLAALMTGDVARTQACIGTLARNPYPLFVISPDNPGVDVAVTTVADAGWLLRAYVPAANDSSVTTAYNTSLTIDVRTTAYDINTSASGLTVSIATAPTSGTAAVQSDGTILFTPATGFSGTSTFTYTVTDTTGASSTAAVTVVISAPTITLSPAALPTAQAGTAYTQTLTASGGAAPYSCRLSAGALPAGLMLSSSGTISGTATVAGTYNFVISVTDSSTGTGPFTAVQNFSLTVNPSTASVITLSGFPTKTTAGAAHSLTVTVKDAYGNIVTGHVGTVQFSSSDKHAGLPTNYTFTTADAGKHIFSVTLKTAGTQWVTATDPATASLTGTQSGIRVTAAAASQLLIVGLPSSVTHGVAQSFTLEVVDAYGNIVTGYTSIVHFGSSDAHAVLPANYTFTKGNAGKHTFKVTFKTTGTQSLKVTDTAQSSLTGRQLGILVV